MTRDSLVRLSDAEKARLDRVRRNVFNSDSVPYGEVVDHLARHELDD